MAKKQIYLTLCGVTTDFSRLIRDNTFELTAPELIKGLDFEKDFKHENFDPGYWYPEKDLFIKVTLECPFEEKI